MTSVWLNPVPVPDKPHTRYLTVTEGDDETIVHWHYKRGPHQPAYRFNCSACGQGDAANTCAHIFAAALVLAGELLGLTAAGAP